MVTEPQLYEVTCPVCTSSRQVTRVSFWRSNNGQTKNCKSCSVTGRTYAYKPRPNNDGPAIAARMTGNTYATGSNPSLEERKRRSEVMKGNKFREGYTGKKVWNWKGGITNADRLQRIKFRQTMQKQIFERDSYTCTICTTQGNVQVDHIKRWSEYPELRFEPTNCRTLCMACHYEITFGRKLPKGQVWGHNLKHLILTEIQG